jgi:hypothetical protein
LFFSFAPYSTVCGQFKSFFLFTPFNCQAKEKILASKLAMEIGQPFCVSPRREQATARTCFGTLFSACIDEVACRNTFSPWLVHAVATHRRVDRFPSPILMLEFSLLLGS